MNTSTGRSVLEELSEPLGSHDKSSACYPNPKAQNGPNPTLGPKTSKYELLEPEIQGAKYPSREVSKVSLSGIVIMVLSRCLVFENLEP